eukprot:gene1927-33337_t
MEANAALAETKHWVDTYTSWGYSRGICTCPPCSTSYEEGALLGIRTNAICRSNGLLHKRRHGSEFPSGTKLLKEYLAAQQQADARDALTDGDEVMVGADDDATMNDAAACVPRLTGPALDEAVLADVALEQVAAIRAEEVYVADLAVVQAQAQADAANLVLAQAQAERQAAADIIAQAAEDPLNHRAHVHTKYGTVSWYARRGMDYKNVPPKKSYLSQRLPGSDGSCTYNPKSLSPLMFEDAEMPKVAGPVCGDHSVTHSLAMLR